MTIIHRSVGDIDYTFVTDEKPWDILENENSLRPWTPGAAIERIKDAMAVEGSQGDIAYVGLMLTDFLISKNKRYGDSALNPIDVFARGLTPEQKRAVRKDDKINRIIRGAESQDGENPIVDLVGYLILDLVADYQNGKLDG